jgi:16S rRNA (uracil1498-N3)-methyltransferase
MHRFYLPPAPAAGPELELADREAHHAFQVLRLREGELVTLLDGVGGTAQARITACGKRSVRLAVQQLHQAAPPLCQITLLQAVPRAKLIEAIIQKATELGARRIVPLLTERVVRQLGGEEAATCQERWQQVAIEAIKQCGQPWLPRIEPPMTPAAWLARQEAFELPLIASLQPATTHPRICFDRFRARHQRPPHSLGLWIGPEGDFTPAETAAALAAGAQPITLGPLVLRVETAALAALALCQHELTSP